MLQITERDTTEALQFTSDLIDEIGPRLAGTPACLQAAERIHDELASVCDSAKIESFSFHREAFLSFTKVFFFAYLSAIPVLIFGGYWFVPAILGLLFGSGFALDLTVIGCLSHIPVTTSTESSQSASPTLTGFVCFNGIVGHLPPCVGFYSFFEIMSFSIL